MESKRPLRIAVVGIDGTGKSTVVESIKKRFEEKGKFGRLKNLPRPDKHYKPTNRVEKLLQEIAFRGDEKKDKFQVVVSQVGQNMIYPFLRIGAEKGKDIVIYERHPYIDYPVYGPEYGGKLATKIGMFLSGAPYPDVIIHLDGDPAKAHKRILSRAPGMSRKNVPHLHETVEGMIRARKRFETVIRDIVKKRPDTKVIKLDAEKSRKEVLAELHKRLDELGI